MEHEYTDELICPFCDGVQSDAWELLNDSEDVHCGHCGKLFFYQRHVEVTYTSRKKSEGRR